jgi:hypothetical protein
VSWLRPRCEKSAAFDFGSNQGAAAPAKLRLPERAEQRCANRSGVDGIDVAEDLEMLAPVRRECIAQRHYQAFITAGAGAAFAAGGAFPPGNSGRTKGAR